eukprot:279063-Rhodomonas_salina.1
MPQFSAHSLSAALQLGYTKRKQAREGRTRAQRAARDTGSKPCRRYQNLTPHLQQAHAAPPLTLPRPHIPP